MIATGRLRSRDVLTWLATLAPALLAAGLVAGNGLDVLFMDDWDLVGGTLVRAAAGPLGLATLLAQHNESRPLVPRLLFLLVGTAARGDVRWLLAVNLALGWLVSWGLFVLIRATATARPGQAWCLGFLANLLVFTPKQAETWLWCSYLGLEPAACLCGALAVLHARRSGTARALLAALLCTAATFSYANGLVTWLLVAPVVLATAGRRWLAAWTLGFALIAAVYFHGYVQPPPLPLDFVSPWPLAHFVLVFLGAPLGLDRPGLAAGIGAFLLVLLGLLALYALRHLSDASLRDRLLPWLALGGYSVASAGAAALGRSRFGASHALASRYVPFSLYLGVAVLVATFVAVEHWGGSSPRPRLRAGLAVALAGFLALQAGSSVIGIRQVVHAARMRRSGKGRLLFVLVRPADQCLVDWVYPSPASLRDTASALDRLGYLRPPLVRSARLQDLLAPGVPAATGALEAVATRRARFVVEGWAGLPAAGGPADAVVVAERQANGDWTPIGFAPVLGRRPDVAQRRGRALADSGWRADLVRRDFTGRTVELGAWALDVQQGKASPLQGTAAVTGPPPRP